MQFGIPKKRQVKSELFPDTCVMTVHKAGEKGSARTVSFNSMAADLLSINDNDTHELVMITDLLEDGSRDVFFTKLDESMEVSNSDKLKVTTGQPKRFSNKRHFDFIVENFELDATEDNHLELTNIICDGVSLIKAVLFTVENENDNEVEPQSEIEQSVTSEQILHTPAYMQETI